MKSKYQKNNDLLERGCLVGDEQMVNKALNDMDGRANDYNRGLRSACRGGNILMVMKMIELGANDFEEAKKIATQNHRKDIVSFIDSILLGFRSHGIGKRSKKLKKYRKKSNKKNKRKVSKKRFGFS